MRNVLTSKKNGNRNSLSACRLQRFWKNRSLRIEPLEQRRLLSVDLYLDMFRVDPDSTNVEKRLDLHVDYEVRYAQSDPFDIGIYSSVDGVTPGTLLMTYPVTDTAHRTVDNHTAVFKANFEDAPFDYYLMAKLDAYDAVVETDEGSNPTEDNNLARFDGGTFMGADRTTNVVGRHVFYNESTFDGGDPAAEAADDTAIAPDKFPLLHSRDAVELFPAQQPMFRNYTSYDKGLNGVMVDIWNLPEVPANPGSFLITASDFTFESWGAGWETNVSPPTVVPRQLEDGVTRVTLTWSENDAVKDNWLKVKVLANPNTGLEHDDIFYFGSLRGDVDGLVFGNAIFLTTSADETAVDNNRTASATIENRYDLDRDGDVDDADVDVAIDYINSSLMFWDAQTAEVLRRAPGLGRGVAYREAFGAKRPLFAVNFLHLAA